mmetsp:Transcript_26513/g.47926  ORF Transcript_26513/g.47926 Transcript_26513/m.47926 type:complete len:215 (+) Transcript_26513:164-808(+)
MDNAQFQQLLAALQQGLQPLQPPPQAPVAFAKSPGQANPDQPIDYSTTAGQKQWQEATAPLSIKFKVEDKQVNQFNEILMERAEKQGWATGNSSILTINIDGNDYNLIREYGRIPMETLRNTVTKKVVSRSSRNKTSIISAQRTIALHRDHSYSSYSCRRLSSTRGLPHHSFARTCQALILTWRLSSPTSKNSMSTSSRTTKDSWHVVKDATIS